MINLPEWLENELKNQYSQEEINEIKQGFKINRKTTFRVNTLKSNKQEIIDELKKYNIEYEKCINLKELIFYIEDILQEEDLSDLEEIEKSISERDYYENTNK